MFFLDCFEERENYCKSKVVVGDCAGVTSGEAQRHKQELQAIKEPIESQICASRFQNWSRHRLASMSCPCRPAQRYHRLEKICKNGFLLGWQEMTVDSNLQHSVQVFAFRSAGKRS